MNDIKWANPTPAGLVALAVACYCFFALLSGRVDHSALPLVGCWLLGGFVVQFTAAVIDLRMNNNAGGNTFLFFAAFFMLVGGLEMIMKYTLGANGMPFDATVDGYAWIVLTLSLLLWTPAFFRTALMPIIILLDLSLPFITLLDLGILDKTFKVIPAYGLLLAGTYAIYLAAAMVVNGTLGKTLYPIFVLTKK